MLSAGLAAAHNVNCYTAVGYTIVCAPKAHDNYDVLGNPAFGFKTGSTAAQTTYGSFTWNEIKITDGYEIQHANLGDTYVWQANPYSPLLYSRAWFCYPVGYATNIAMSSIQLSNNSTTGTWDQYSTLGADCYSPTPYQDFLTWMAY